MFFEDIKTDCKKDTPEENPPPISARYLVLILGYQGRFHIAFTISSPLISYCHWFYFDSYCGTTVIHGRHISSQLVMFTLHSILCIPFCIASLPLPSYPLYLLYCTHPVVSLLINLEWCQRYTQAREPKAT